MSETSLVYRSSSKTDRAIAEKVCLKRTKSKFKIYFIFTYSSVLLSIYINAPCSCLVPTETSRYWTPLELELLISCHVCTGT